MSTNEDLMYFWKAEWLVRWSTEGEWKDCFWIVVFDMFLASSLTEQLTATPRSVVSLQESQHVGARKYGGYNVTEFRVTTHKNSIRSCKHDKRL